MKRIIGLFLAFILVLSSLPLVASAEFDPSSVSTPYIVLMDAVSGSILYEKKGYEQAYPASTTKIMTCILTLEKCSDLNEVVTVGSHVETRGSVMGIVRGEQMRLIDLLYGMMLVSGNDAAQAIAEFVAGSEAEFAVLMNQKAKDLGMTGTNFVKSNGLHKEDHYSTAYDMAILTRYAMQNPKFREIVDAKTWKVEPSKWDKDGYLLENTNKLLHTKADKESFTYRYATGVKTGDTDNAGRCLVASAEKNGVSLLLVLFGDYARSVSADYRYINAAEFFEWGFANYATLDADKLELERSITLPVKNADIAQNESGNLQIDIALSGVQIHGAKEDIAAIQNDPSLLVSSYVLDKLIEAPITEGEVLGTMFYKYQGSTLFQADLVAAQSVNKLGAQAATPNASSALVIDSWTENNEPGSTVVFFVLLAVVLLVLFAIYRVLVVRRRTRKRVARRPTHYRVYRKP